MGNALQLIGGSVLKGLESPMKERKAIKITDIAIKENSMTDKVQKIREEVEKRYECWREKELNSHSIESEIRMSECQHLLLMLNSLQEEPTSNDLKEAARKVGQKYFPDEDNIWARPNYEAKKAERAFEEGAKWGRNQAKVEIQAESMALAHGCPKESVSEDLEEAARKATYFIPEGSRAEIEGDKVIIKRGEQKPQRIVSAEAKEAMYGKPAWSEEDETTRNALINLVEMYYGGCIDESEKNRLLKWLKSLKSRLA